MESYEKQGAASERANARFNTESHVSHAGPDDRPNFVPRIEMRDVYYEMIAAELRDGRLTRARRKRIIQYAAHLGLNAVEAGRMITQCRELALQSEDPDERGHALKLVESEPERVPVPFKIAVVVAIAIAVDLIFLGLMR